MRYVALTAATLSSAFLLTLGSPALPTASSTDADGNSANKTTNITKLTTSKVLLASQAKTPKTAATNDAAPVQQPEAPQPNMITVAPGDTLSSIAEANGTTFKRLFDANETVKDPNVIYPADQLRIPTADEQLADRPLPAAAPAVVAPAPVVAAAPAPVRIPATSNAPAVADGSVWDRLAQCEAGGNWAINTGNGFYGGLQFTQSSWQAVGGSGMPNQASREEQVLRGQMLQARQGWGAWPACSAKLGLY